MSHRRPDPRQAGLETVLRSALRLAADSVEPAADGLDRIRAKISARQPALQPAWMSAAPVVALLALLRRLDPAVIWLRYALGVVADRFKPDPDRAGRLGWLRPAAALATVLFVVASASWAITALPQVFVPATNQNPFTGGGSPNATGGPMPSGSGTNSTVGGVGWPPPSGSPSASPSCTSASPTNSKSPSPTPSQSSSPSPSTSPTQSTSPSPTPSVTPTTGTPSPSDSPSTAASTNSPGAQSLRSSLSASGSSGTTAGSPPGSSAAHGAAAPAPPSSKLPRTPPCGA